jgi:hypothetical protein
MFSRHSIFRALYFSRHFYPYFRALYLVAPFFPFFHAFFAP